MMRKMFALLAGAMLLPAAANAATTVDQRGTRVINILTGVLAQDGETLGDASFNGSTDPLPFDRLIGGDSPGPNFSAAWSHTYGALDGTVSSALVEIGIFDLDSIGAGDQIALFTLNGIDLTAALNAVAESKPHASGRYTILELTLPSLVHAQLLTGTTNFLLTLQNGFSGGQPRPFNGAIIDFAKLTINTQAIDPGPQPVPEPATWAMMIAGFGLVGGAMRARRTTVRFA